MESGPQGLISKKKEMPENAITGHFHDINVTTFTLLEPKQPNPLMLLLYGQFRSGYRGLLSLLAKDINRQILQGQIPQSAGHTPQRVWRFREISPLALSFLVRFRSLRRVMLRQWLQASIQATRRAVAWNLKDISPPAELTLFNFASPEDVKHWEVYSDSKYGGLSSANLDLMTKRRNTSGIFSGSLSADVVEDEESATLKRSGFVGIRTSDDRRKFDLEPFQALLFRVRGDGRCYISSLRTESWVTASNDGEFNTWQAFLFAPKDEWKTVEIPLSRYVPTWRGKILPVDHEMNLRSVTGLGVSTTVEGPEEATNGPGDFRLEIQWIKAIQKRL